jgi:hypothetical protein
LRLKPIKESSVSFKDDLKMLVVTSQFKLSNVYASSKHICATATVEIGPIKINYVCIPFPNNFSGEHSMVNFPEMFVDVLRANINKAICDKLDELYPDSNNLKLEKLVCPPESQ